MRSEHRFVFDVNVVISAAIAENSRPEQSLKKAIRAGTVVVSDSVVDELVEVLNRKKFDCYLSLEKRAVFLKNFLSVAKVVTVSERITACRDPSDDKYLELAVAANASAIVSGDPDLLALNPFRNIPVLSPNEFLDADFS
ncbi:MAG: putative toxin-antitoxin system toxin component, PIN family [Chloroherpetonaceae bacterium]